MLSHYVLNVITYMHLSSLENMKLHQQISKALEMYGSHHLHCQTTNMQNTAH